MWAYRCPPSSRSQARQQERPLARGEDGGRSWIIEFPARRYGKHPVSRYRGAGIRRETPTAEEVSHAPRE
ncbi:hypothetical protein GCM10027521_61520 [Amycolatopsis cihanbeyliensis]